ncbi:cytochrome P450 [Streptomyces gilvus]|uniref:cytochrome P450 n=1 Tax=Streptomyces gilvus TaxID=2920937 RepID=UPI001F0FFC03|nr:cytochrome P450 [Streptomyces sp. CME 23]MCH5675609.1 cytochrome P450 [Streptomyces sp. CME 23]
MAIPRIQDLDDPTFDPYVSDEVMFGSMPDMHERVAEVRAQCPVHKGSWFTSMGLMPTPEEQVWPEVYRVMTYDGVQQVLNNPEIFSNRAFEPTLGSSFGPHSLSVLDNPEHLKYRKIFQKAFLPNVVGRWGDVYVQPVIDELFGAFREAGKADLVPQFSQLYPFRVIYRMLGMPDEDLAVFQKLMLTQIFFSFAPDKAKEASEKLGTYFTALIEERLENPGEDLVSALATAEVDGERLPVAYVVDFLRQLFNAGGDTTYRATANLLVALLRDGGELYRRVRDDRSLLPRAVEEVIRWESPVSSTNRLVLRDTEIEGVKIPANSVVNASLASADRDETKYACPEKFDIDREQRPKHMGFGQGPHVCIGQHLARVEITRAMETLMDEFPDLRLDPDEDEPVIVGAMLRSPRHVHVRFD